MKIIKGTPYNIDGECLGKVTFSKHFFGKGNYVYVSKNTDKVSGYAATISTQSANADKNCCIVDNIDEFNEGDVVSIDEKGTIVFLFEINSNHNAIFATGRCNHRCIMCPQPPITQEASKTAYNLKLIDLYDKDCKEVGITGGEPTLLGDELFDLIRHINNRLPRTAISLLSNGVKFADREYAMKLALCKSYNLQIDVPLFSDIADEHNAIVGANTFYKTVQGLYNLALFRQRIGLRIVVHKKTYRRLPQLADYIYHNFPFVAQVAFMRMETTGLAEKNIEDLWIDPYDYNKELKEAVFLLEDRDIKTYVYNAQLCVLDSSLYKFAPQSISEWKDIYIEECKKCSLKDKCGGMFASNAKYHSSHIHSITENSGETECFFSN